MSDARHDLGRLIEPPESFRARAHVPSRKAYEELYHRSVESPEEFWAEQAKRLQWMKEPTEVLKWNFDEPRIEWFRDGMLNVSVNCLDRHVEAGYGDRVAFFWEGDDVSEHKEITYRELLEDVCRFGNALRHLGVRKGDRVCIYMPMLSELVVAMLACARIGAVHSIVFGGFSAEALRDRILDSSCKILITADEAMRGGRHVGLKNTSDAAVAECPCIEKVVVVRNSGGGIEKWHADRDLWWHELVHDFAHQGPCAPEPMGAEDPLFILYTSGSTGKPKGVLHTQAGYLLYASYTHEMVFDYHEDDVYWCTADIGWITGHSYIVYGPLANRATGILFEGVPTYPNAGRFWEVVDKHKVTLFYTAPTAIRALHHYGDEYVTRHSRKTLRLLGTVGEPINPEAWHWYHDVIGEGRCPIVDTYWQTETGGILISPLPGATPLKPGSATLPMPGVRPRIVDKKGREIEGAGAHGNLVIDFPWPGMMRTVYGDHARFKETYFTAFPGHYFTGDGAWRDGDGYFWITGRVDDVLNVSGHRLGTAEIESALVTHPSVSEAAVVGMPHEVKGQGIYAFVHLVKEAEASEELHGQLIAAVREHIGPVASPDAIQMVHALPKTRSGKIMRRILRKIAAGDVENLGDTSTLADPSVVEELLKTRPLDP